MVQIVNDSHWSRTPGGRSSDSVSERDSVLFSPVRIQLAFGFQWIRFFRLILFLVPSPQSSSPHLISGDWCIRENWQVWHILWWPYPKMCVLTQRLIFKSPFPLSRRHFHLILQCAMHMMMMTYMLLLGWNRTVYVTDSISFDKTARKSATAHLGKSVYYMWQFYKNHIDFFHLVFVPKLCLQFALVFIA